MATLALGIAGAVAGSALLPEGIAVLGATISGASIGSQIGAFAGRAIDQSLFGASGQTRQVHGPRLSNLHVMLSGHGGHIPRVYGRARVGGQVIWATDFEEEAVDDSAGGSGKGTGQPAASSSPGTQYRYFANFAVALCEGPITRLGRVWADGRELDLSEIVIRFYDGHDDQQPDSLIVAKVGAELTPAYRGIAYVVFERLPLSPHGNRLPQLSFEVIRAVDPFEAQIRAVTMIPGAGEFVYEPAEVIRDIGLGVSATENRHTLLGGSDWSVSLDQLRETLPNAGRVSLFVSWFGTDLRAGHCQLVPGVDSADKATSPFTWSVAGLGRNQARLLSQSGGRPSYGGTPSDLSIIHAIQDLRARGLAVTLTPFPLLDIPAGNALPDPYSAASSQPTYPWRGRITVDPAPGRSDSPDKTAAAAAQIAAFVGTAAPADFALNGTTVTYTGPAEWSYRRMILHNAVLAKAAGGIDTFLIGSELRGLTWSRSGPSTYPFVAALAAIGADVKSILGPSTKVTYAADWSEYFGHQPADGSGDVSFHLDPLWASSAIDAIGIDVYWPLADWRPGPSHLDRDAGARSPYDLDYLKSNIFGGEGYDWYYASSADRQAQTRTPITDGLGKPWLYRFKDIRNWWLNAHHNRPGGIEQATPTAWQPQSKPIWLTEVGCPAIDLGANQPNVFNDPKSVESALPYFSNGTRDDFAQRRYLRAIHEFFDPAAPGFAAANNPISSAYAGPMVAPDRITTYTWDARPYPAFPSLSSVWGDSANWAFGHWLSGRLASAPLAETIAAILHDDGFTDFDVSQVEGVLDGYVIDRIMSARDALQPLELSQFIDSYESNGRIHFVSRARNSEAATVTAANLVETKPGASLAELTRAQETELPAAAKLTFYDGESSYAHAVVESRRSTTASHHIATADVPVVMDGARAQAMADAWLYEAWSARERAAFALPPSALALEPSDIVSVSLGDRSHRVRITEIGDAAGRHITAVGVDPAIYDRVPAPSRTEPGIPPPAFGVPNVVFLDLPLLRDDASPRAGTAAAYADPWPGGIAIYNSPEATGYKLATVARQRASIGRTLSSLPHHAAGRWDHTNTLLVQLGSGILTSATALGLFEGRNLAAVARPDGSWEVLQFLSTELVAPLTYRLSGLLRGQAGSGLDDGLTTPSTVPEQSTIVILDAALQSIDLATADVGRTLSWRFGPSNRDIGSPNFTTRSFAFRGTGLVPLSPVHIRANRAGNGDIALSWTRRTRQGGDSWAIAEVPLAEDSERYEVDILDPANPSRVVRTLSAASPTITYTQAQQLADLGSAQSSLPVRVAQLSALVGRGTPASAVV